MPRQVANKQRAESVAAILKTVTAQSNVIEGFGASVEAILTKNSKIEPLVHSFKRRFKSEKSLKNKINEKRRGGRSITSHNVFREITDLYAVRLIHLYPQDISTIHKQILDHAEKKDWILVEKPKAYTWDPESVAFLKKLGLRCELKPSYYTSVHYLVKPHNKSIAVCEIQVRSLLEEVWGEVDHQCKYKNRKIDSRIQEHLAVLARLVGAGSHLISALHSR